jgi:hypothetical protein
LIHQARYSALTHQRLHSQAGVSNIVGAGAWQGSAAGGNNPLGIGDAGKPCPWTDVPAAVVEVARAEELGPGGVTVGPATGVGGVGFESGSEARAAIG